MTAVSRMRYRKLSFPDKNSMSGKNELGGLIDEILNLTTMFDNFNGVDNYYTPTLAIVPAVLSSFI